MTRSAPSGGDRLGARGAQLLLEAERVGLVDAAAEGDDRVLHQCHFEPASAFRPMSRRYCMPSNEICVDAGVRARDRLGEVVAAADDGQHAAAGGDELTVAQRRSRRDRPRRPECASARRCRRSGGPIRTTPDSRARRARRRRARRARCGPMPVAEPPVAAGDEQRQQRLVDQRQDDLRFRIAEPHVELDDLRAGRRSASGRRTGTRGTDDPRRPFRRCTGSTISRMTRASSAASTSGLGANAPIPPVFGPRSSSKIRL